MLRISPPWTIGKIDRLLVEADLLIADLVYVEVVRGAKTNAEANLLRAKFNSFEQVSVCGIVIAEKAVEHHQYLRSKGITIRGTVDLMIATWCIELSLIHI